MGASLHRIRRQRWSVRASSREQAFAVRHWLREHCGAELQDALEVAFDRMAPAGRIVRLTRLDIDLRVNDVAELASLLPSRIVETFPHVVAAGESPVALPPAAANDHDALRQYVLTGNVAWPRRPDERSTLPSLQAAARMTASTMVSELIAHADVRVAATALFRLFQLVEEKQWPLLIASVERGAGSRGTEILRRLWRLLPPSTSVADRLQRIVSPSMSGDHPDRSFEESDLPQKASPLAVDAFTIEDGPTETLPQLAAANRALTAGNAAESGAGRAPLSDHEPGWEADVVRTSEWRVAEGAFASAAAHAGLVLLHPFLPQFFRATGADLSASPFPATRARAAALLHFVATGRDEPYELELGLIKILVGLTPDTPLPVSNGLLTDADRDEAHGLLQATIAHWQALRQSSIAAVRASFLQRPGLVKFDDNGWRLQVQPGPFDVLLQRLPWSAAVVKLPWMNAPLHCEWLTS